ncbi:unnamed protein product [Clonostachys byssicola]|uniref:Secretory phospholipase A2 n=1 Tax=Clonostachys byssicola TaxID=160290 RepID=A0A9N9XXT9_9HYPO|nr:unnamed protein product [Clonostachys byssicola]
MKFSTVLTFAAGVFSMPARRSNSSDIATTDEYLFSISLPAFEAKHSEKDPASLDWTTDGCTKSPDNPLGFNFLPACHRHDFGYNNYRDQSRFTESGKKKIDDNFLSDLRYLCESEEAKFACDALAEVYYAAVRAFGGDDASPSKRSNELEAIYRAKLAQYEAIVKEAQAKGELPQ